MPSTEPWQQVYYITKNICKTIKHLGFKINPYDPCVANRTIDDNPQTIYWHVDYCKISHVDLKFNDKLIKSLKQEYEIIFEDGTGEMTVNRGKKHKYLGTTLDYSKEGACQITMFENLKAILETFDKIDTKEKGTKKSAAPANLFPVQEDCKKLDKERSEQFHSIVEQLLFTNKFSRPDTGTAVLFLTTRV